MRIVVIRIVFPLAQLLPRLLRVPLRLTQRLPHLSARLVQIFAGLLIRALQLPAQFVSGFFQLPLRFVLRLPAFFSRAILVSPAAPYSSHQRDRDAAYSDPPVHARLS